MEERVNLVESYQFIKVLLIEDESGFREDFLEGFKVYYPNAVIDEARFYDEAMEYINNPYTVVICDIQLRKSSHENILTRMGLDLLRKLSEQQCTQPRFLFAWTVLPKEHINPELKPLKVHYVSKHKGVLILISEIIKSFR